MKVSVIIPVYNKAAYVGACLENTLQQDLDDFEVICVNDGSTDGSGDICDQWAATDNRIKVFHTENGGVTAARRLGLEHSNGKYVIFVDSDDWLMPNALKIMYDTIEKTSADEVVGTFENQYNAISSVVYRGFADIKQIKQLVITNKIYFLSFCGNLFSREKISDCLDLSRNIISGEDLLTVLKFLMKAPKVYFIENCVYHYNWGVPNNRKFSLEKEILYDTLLRQILATEWETYQTDYVFHQIKQYEEFLVLGKYDVYKKYYQQAIPSPLPTGIPLFRRFVWSLPPRIARLFVMIYRKLLTLKGGIW